MESRNLNGHYRIELLTTFVQVSKNGLCVYEKFTKIGTQSATEQMSLKKITGNDHHSWGLWRIDDEDMPFEEANAYESIPESLTNHVKQKEWVAGRRLVKTLMEKSGLTFRGIVKDEFGKPFPAESSYHLSLSHSFPYVAAYLHKSESVGIDLEQPKEKLFRIAPRILDAEELITAGNDVRKHCIIWCAKEVLVKVHGKKDLVFAQNLKISPFAIKPIGEITGRIIVNNHDTIVPMYYEIHEDFIVVLNKPNPK